MNEERYWGLYCLEIDSWMLKTDGDIMYWPSPHIAEAYKRMRDKETPNSGYKLVVREFAATEKAMSA